MALSSSVNVERDPYGYLQHSITEVLLWDNQLEIKHNKQQNMASVIYKYKRQELFSLKKMNYGFIK